MEILIFSSFLIIEIVLAVIGLAKRGNLPERESKIRIGNLILFGFLIITGMVEWGARWMAFAALLIIRAVLGAIWLLRGKSATKVQKPTRIVLKTIGNGFLLFIVLIPAFMFPSTKPIATTGEYKTATQVKTFTDFSRVEANTEKGGFRDITVECWYPMGSEGLNPLVVFSHGSFGVRTSNESLFRELASHGYVVCSLDHPFQSFFSTDESGKTVYLDGGFFREVTSEDAGTDPHHSFELYQKWMGIRTADINFVMDSILDQVSQPDSPAVYHQIDPTRIGVMGHSMGGSAALAIGRQRNDVDAVIALEAPFMGDIQGVEDGLFIWNETPYPLPLMNIYSDSSWTHLSEWPQYAGNAHLLSDALPGVENVYLAGARHLTLTDLALTSPFLTNVLNGGKADLDAREGLTEINRLVLKFLDHNLK